MNATMLVLKLGGLGVLFVSGSFDEKSYPADQTIRLKTGAQVMLLNNDSLGRWVNGTIGTVTRIAGGRRGKTVGEIGAGQRAAQRTRARGVVHALQVSRARLGTASLDAAGHVLQRRMDGHLGVLHSRCDRRVV